MVRDSTVVDVVVDITSGAGSVVVDDLSVSVVSAFGLSVIVRELVPSTTTGSGSPNAETNSTPLRTATSTKADASDNNNRPFVSIAPPP